MNDAATTRRGIAILLWALLFCVVNDALAAIWGIDDVNTIVWPTQIQTFRQLDWGPIDVAVLGSSRASFAVTPAELDRCLESELGRPTQTVNLGRAFETGYTMDLLARRLLDGERLPRVLVLVLGPEALNANNHQRAVALSRAPRLPDLPEALTMVRGWDDLVGALRPVVAGTESLVLYLTRRQRTEARLHWMMLHFGGGQYCGPDGPEVCEINDRENQGTLSLRWAAAREKLLPQLAEQRFSNAKLDEGPPREHLEALIDWAGARGTRVVLVGAPLSLEYSEKLPRPVVTAWHDGLDELGQREGATTFWSRRLSGHERFFLDPDHVNLSGSVRLTDELCHGPVGDALKN